MDIHATLKGGEQPRSLFLSGRIAQTLHHLHRAGPKGITTLDWPAMRLSAYVHSLRKLGFEDLKSALADQEAYGALAKQFCLCLADKQVCICTSRDAMLKRRQ